MSNLSTPFSFIRWEECFEIGYDHFCQEVWDWNPILDTLYPPRVPYRCWPWSGIPAMYDCADVGENAFTCGGMASVWISRTSEMQIEDYFFCEDPSCEWEPHEGALFWDDLGFILVPYQDHFVSSSSALPVGELVDELCEKATIDLSLIREPLVERCAEKSLSEAFGLYCVLNFAYHGRPVFGKFCSGFVEFLGSFSYRIKAERDKNK